MSQGTRTRCLALAAATLLAACSSGRDKLLADLQSSRPEERALAVKKLADLGNADDVVLFSQAAKDPVSIVRAEAMTALGKAQDPRVVDLLGEGLSDSDELVQVRAAAALASQKTDKARAYMAVQYARRGRPTRQAIVAGLKASNLPGAMATVVAAEAKGIWERNLKALEEGSPPERAGAAEELGRSGRPDAVNRLVALLRDKQVQVAVGALRGLGHARDPRAAASIVPLLAENDPELRSVACEVLGTLGDAAALPRLREVALERSVASLLATRALAALPRSVEADAALCEVVGSGSAAEALAAGRAMQRRGGCPLEPLLPRLAQPGQQAQALLALASLGPAAKDAAARVVPLLTSADGALRRLAAEALIALGNRDAAPAVAKAFEAELKQLDTLRADWVGRALPQKYAPGFDPAAPPDPDDPLMLARSRHGELMRKVQALEQARAADAGRVVVTTPPPSEVVDDASEEQLRGLAVLVRALGALGAEGAAEKIAPFAQESSASVRLAALLAAAALGGPSLELARAGLLDSDRGVMGAVAQALAQRGPDGKLLVVQVAAARTGERVRLLEEVEGGLPPEAAAPLQAILADGGLESGRAALLLAELGAKDAVPAMLKALDDLSNVARVDLLRALATLGDPRAVTPVARDLYHDSPEVRAAAAAALASLGAGDDLDALDALKGDYDRRVREAAEAALARLGADQKR